MSARDEEAFLGACLLDPRAIRVGIALELPANAFTLTFRGAAWDGIQTMFHANRPVDVFTLGDHLRATGTWEDGAALLVDGWVDAAIPEHAAWHADIVLREYLRGAVALRAGRLAVDIAEGEYADVLATGLAELDALRSAARDSRTWKETALDRVLQTIGPQKIGLPSQYRDIRVTIGTYRGYVIIAGRPSTGKTTFIWNEIAHWCEAGHRVAVASPDADADEILLRVACERADASAFSLSQGGVSEAVHERVRAEINHVLTWPLEILDKACSAEQFCAWARAEAGRGAKAIVLDHIQKLRVTERQHRGLNETMTIISNHIQALRKDVRVPMIVLCQLSRGMALQNRLPELHDLRDSGSLEQDADLVLAFHRYQDDPEDEKQLCRILKHKGGPTNDVYLRHVRNRQRFADWCDGVPPAFAAPPAQEPAQPAPNDGPRQPGQGNWWNK